MAWGSGSFENDEAAAWLKNLPAITPQDLTRVLVQAADDPGYVEAPAARVAVAPSEVVASLNGAPSEGRPPEIADWARKHERAFTPELKAVAMRALDRVRRNSELKDLWLEADGLNDWIQALKDLQTRLG